MPKLRGTPEQRRQQKAERRVANVTGFVRARASAAGDHERVVVACNAALAASRRIDPSARKALANAIAKAVETFDNPSRRKEKS
jgi:hypothetical protein